MWVYKLGRRWPERMGEREGGDEERNEKRGVVKGGGGQCGSWR